MTHSQTTCSVLTAFVSQVRSEKIRNIRRRDKANREAEGDMDDEDPPTDDMFQRTDIRNTDEVDIKALMHNKTAYYELAHTSRETITKQPDMLMGGTLRQYQIQGLQWLVSLYNNNLSGVLADEMVFTQCLSVLGWSFRYSSHILEKFVFFSSVRFRVQGLQISAFYGCNLYCQEMRFP